MVDTGNKTNTPQSPKTPKRLLIFYYAVTLAVLMLLTWLFFPALMQRRVTEVGYDEFTAMLDEGRVQTVAYDQPESQIVFEATDEDGKPAVYKPGI